MAASDNRRKRKPLAVHWPLRLFRQPGTGAVESTTENISGEGLYCVSRQPFKPGERLQCEILIPRASIGASESALRLQCYVTVRRVEELPDGFGLGCHFEDYTLDTGSPLMR
jgi:hypothetical protein